MTRMPALIIAAIAFVLPLRESARSQESAGNDSIRPSFQSVGTLAGHTFVLATYIRDPFVRTYLRTGLGFGMTPALEPPPVVIDGVSVEGLKGSLLFAIMAFDYQHAIRDWLAVRAALKVVGRLANETRPLLAQGVTLYGEFELGWLFRVMQSERTFLSASLEIRNSSLTDVYLQRFIEGVIDSGGISRGNHLVEVTPALQGGGGLHMAYAFSDLVGLTANASLYYGESSDRSKGEGWSYLVRAAVDFNLSSTGGPPLGFAVGASTGSPVDVSGMGDATTQTFFGRIGYTGSREFALGLDLAYDLVPIRNAESKQGFMSALIDIRLYF
jgi:hypothetical protein